MPRRASQTATRPFHRKAAWILWAKLGGLQVTASSLIGGESFSAGALVYPLANVVGYCCVLGALCYLGFSREDIV